MFTEALTKIGGSLLEAPITGGLEALKKGQMAVWVAGDKVIPYHFRQHKSTFQAKYLDTKPILDASYSTVQYTGGLGTAMIPKVLSNMLCGLQVGQLGPSQIPQAMLPKVLNLTRIQGVRHGGGDADREAQWSRPGGVLARDPHVRWQLLPLGDLWAQRLPWRVP